MYKQDIIISSILIVFFIKISSLLDVSLHENSRSDFITFFTVYLGFIMATFAIMAENKEIKELYKIPDEEDNNIRLLHRLANYFLTNLTFIIIAIIVLLLSDLFPIVNCIASKVVIGLFFATIYSSIMLIKILFDIFTNKKVPK